MMKRSNTTLTAARRQAAIDPTFWRCRDVGVDARKLSHVSLAFFRDRPNHVALYCSREAALSAGAAEAIALRRGMHPADFLKTWAALVLKRHIEPRALPEVMAALAVALDVPQLSEVIDRRAA